MVRRERQWPGVGGKRGEWLMSGLHADWEGGNFSLGALPLPLLLKRDNLTTSRSAWVYSAYRRLSESPRQASSLVRHDIAATSMQAAWRGKRAKAVLRVVRDQQAAVRKSLASAASLGAYRSETWERVGARS